MVPYEVTTKDCLTEMFKRVGEEYPNENLTKNSQWYTRRIWTQEDEDDFKGWMSNFLKKRYRFFNKKNIELEVSMFVLMWGWKVGEKNSKNT